MPTRKFRLAAAWVAPMAGHPLRDASVVFAGGKIIDVGSSKLLSSTHPDAELIDAADAAILPGLVNAHTHLELSHCASGAPPTGPGDFTNWVLSLPRRTGRDGDVPEITLANATRAGMAQCLRFGVTCVGDISQHVAATRPVLRDTPLRAVSYGEVLGLAGLRAKYEQLLKGALDASCATDRLRIGLTPHAPYTVDAEGYAECLALAREQSLPLATHLAETPDEALFLADHRGPFRDLWELLGQWKPGVAKFAGGPIHYMKSLGLLDYPTLLAHVNYCDDEELNMLAAGDTSVVYCPRTHRYFGHPPHQWRDMLARGINVAIGTDSCASSPDLNLLDDLRLLHEISPEVSPGVLWQMATTRGARAISMGDTVGALSPAMAADFTVFRCADTADPLREILERNIAPAQVWVAGVRVDAEGRN